MKRHKWYNEIVAWADGAEIEFKDEADLNEWLDTDVPFWDDGEGIEYRIKPQPKEPQYLYVYYGRLSNNASGYFFEQQRLSGIEGGYIGKIKLEVDDE